MSNNKPQQVITRFAPSPTGDLHIGGARTALFNYLFAKRHNGKFLLRIEDTDKARSTPQAVAAILDGMAWLGLEADEPPIYQAQRANRHAEVAHELIASGKAFKCYLTPEQATIQREKAMAAGHAFRSPYRDGDHQNNFSPFVVRLRAPDDDVAIIIDDKVQGPVRTMGKDLDDMVLLRTDDSPTYMLAVVVDDYDMKITHVIRGDDHLTNAARQSVLIDALGWQRPIYAHIPLIHGSDGKKLSKRHGALAVGEYEKMGYLPEAMLSYLLRLGWAKGDLDIVPIAEAIEIFDLEGLGKSPSRLDFDKLAQVNAFFMQLADDKRLLEMVRKWAERSQIEIADTDFTKILAAMPILKARAKLIPDLLEQSEFIWAKTPMQFTPKARELVGGFGKEVVTHAATILKELSNWDIEMLRLSLSNLATEKNVGMGKIAPALRAALTGGLVAPDIAQTMEILGKNEVSARLDYATKI
ncbi:MAG: glutamyl-tRNA synthetase [Hyphomonadaceae bacterium]|nr:MAG: glutamyl-tRNA synthetase [Hyphomonadaceae bacterium]